MIRTSENLARPAYACVCKAEMKGPPTENNVWECSRKHHFRVLSTASCVIAEAVRGGNGIQLGKHYIWPAFGGEGSLQG